MEKMITIPKWKFETIENALRLTHRICECHTKITAFDREVVEAYDFAKTALSDYKKLDDDSTNVKNITNIRYLHKPFVIKTKTNSGDLGKQSFRVVVSDDTEPSMLIRKLVLSDDFILYENYKLLKTFKSKGLFELRFSIKMSTLKSVLDIIGNSLNNTNESK